MKVHSRDAAPGSISSAVGRRQATDLLGAPARRPRAAATLSSWTVGVLRVGAPRVALDFARPTVDVGSRGVSASASTSLRASRVEALRGAPRHVWSKVQRPGNRPIEPLLSGGEATTQFGPAALSEDATTTQASADKCSSTNLVDSSWYGARGVSKNISHSRPCSIRNSTIVNRLASRSFSPDILLQTTQKKRVPPLRRTLSASFGKPLITRSRASSPSGASTTEFTEKVTGSCRRCLTSASTSPRLGLPLSLSSASCSEEAPPPPLSLNSSGSWTSGSSASLLGLLASPAPASAPGCSGATPLRQADMRTTIARPRPRLLRPTLNITLPSHEVCAQKEHRAAFVGEDDARSQKSASVHIREVSVRARLQKTPAFPHVGVVGVRRR